MNLSKQHNNWITVGEVINLVRQPVLTYTDKIIKEWHAKLVEKLISFERCTNPGNCLTSNKPPKLCHTCKGWYEKLASLHRNSNKSQIKWRQNCDTSKWPDDAWEVAKFFMSFLGDNKNTVKDAESTDLSSLLNVLEWIEDAAFGGSRRVDLNLVKELRSKVRNAWAHAPKQEMTDTDSNNAFKIAIDFLIDLDKVFSSTEIKECMTKIQFLQDNGLTNVVEAELRTLLILGKELSADVSQMKEEIENLKQDQESDRKSIQENEKKLKNLEDLTKECCVRKKHAIREAEQPKLKSCLPEKSPQFVGRDTEVEKSITHLVEKDSGIVSIVGGPGFGKSSIAIEVAHRLSKQHHIPVIFSYLSNTSTVPEVTLRLCLDVGVCPGEDPKSSLIFWVKSVQGRAVLVMDNIENLLEDETREKFIELLKLVRMHSGGLLQILLTSRRGFDVIGLKAESISIQELDGDSSIQLVRNCCPGKDLEVNYIRKLVSLCGHVPLAICIAASRLKDVDDPEQLLDWLKQKPMKLLQTPLEKVENSFEMSFGRLKEADKSPFIRLSVFDGNFDRGAAEKVTDQDDIEMQNILSRLVNRNLVEQRGKRYSLHPLIRRFLLVRVGFDQERIRAKEGMVEHFLKVSHALTLKYWSKDGFCEARASLKKDAHNFQKTFQLCQEAVGATTLNQRIFEILRESVIYRFSFRFFYHFIVHLLSHEVVNSFLESCAETAKRHHDVTVEVIVKCQMAHITGRKRGWTSDEYAKGMELIKEIFDNGEVILKEESALESRSNYYYNCCLSKTEFTSPQDDGLIQANSCLHKYLEFKENKGQSPLEKLDVPITLLQLARVNRIFEKSIAAGHLERALSLVEISLGNHDFTLCCYKELGDLLFDQEKHQEALRFYDKAMTIHQNLGATNANISSVHLMMNYGLCLSNLSRFEEALCHVEEASNIVEKLSEDYDRSKKEVQRALCEIREKQKDG